MVPIVLGMVAREELNGNLNVLLESPPVRYSLCACELLL